MKATIICSAGVFTLEPDYQDPEIIVAASDHDGVLRRILGDGMPVTSRGKKYRMRLQKKSVGALMTGLLGK